MYLIVTASILAIGFAMYNGEIKGAKRERTKIRVQVLMDPLLDADSAIECSRAIGRAQ